MKASELLTELSELIVKHGDLDIHYECDNMLTDVTSVKLFNESFLGLPPVFVISMLRAVPREPIKSRPER
jgi:hypothetical protein